MNQRIFNKNLLFLVIILGFTFFQGIKAERKNFNSLKSCRNYQYKNGIEFKVKQQNSFQILSTASIEVLDDFLSFAIDEAEVTANANLADFLKLNETLNNEEDLIKDLNIRKNGKLIRRKSQVQKELDFFKLIFSNGFKGIRLIDSCSKNGKKVKVTIEVTDKTYKLAEFLEKKMKLRK